MREGAIAMTPPTDSTVSGADGNRDGKITRDVVLATALEIIDRDGVDGLSMRRLARRLDCDPMTIYRHAPNKAALDRKGTRLNSSHLGMSYAGFCLNKKNARSGANAAGARGTGRRSRSTHRTPS